jgi:hypothetical protein
MRSAAVAVGGGRQARANSRGTVAHGSALMEFEVVELVAAA